MMTLTLAERDSKKTGESALKTKGGCADLHCDGNRDDERGKRRAIGAQISFDEPGSNRRVGKFSSCLLKQNAKVESEMHNTDRSGTVGVSGGDVVYRQQQGES
jgi:hypothetical protein